MKYPLFWLSKLALLPFLISIIGIGCKPTQTTTKKGEPVIATIGNIPLSVKDFKLDYEKKILHSLDTTAYSNESIYNYLDFFINFKLKIIEAQNEGIDEQVDFKRELETYKEQKAKPYLTDSETIDALVKEAFERLQEEVNVSHILISVSGDAEPKDTIMAYEKILEIRQKALEGKSFEYLAQNYSQDPTTKESGGNLGYFTALQTNYAFETASYETLAGSISDLIRTRFGYHFLKVMDRRKSTGKLLTAHIMIKLPKNPTQTDSLEAKKKISKIYDELKQGADWAKLCQQFSDDAATRNKGGELPEFMVGTVIPAYEQTAFELTQEGDFSQPVLIGNNWHIIKLLKKSELGSFKELEPFIRQKVANDSRYEVAQSSLIKKLKIINRFTEYPKGWSQALGLVDASLLKGQWDFAPQNPILDNPLFSFENKTIKRKKNYTIREFFEYVHERQIPKPDFSSPEYYLKVLYDKFIDNTTLAFERSTLEDKYPEYKLLVKEYKEGMMFFQMMNDKVWNKALVDSIGCAKFFTENRQNYKWGLRATVSIYNAANKDILEQVRARVVQGDLFLVPQIKPNNLYYAKNDSNLDAENQDYLLQIAQLLAKDTTLILEISGHADPSENPSLAGQRANKAAEWLSGFKISPNRLIIKDFGITKPVSISERESNRRIEFALYTTSKKELETQFNATDPLNLSIVEGRFQRGENTVLDKIEWNVGKTVLEDGGRFFYIEILQLEDPRLKTYDEAKAAVITDYQFYLENEWLLELKKKYPIKINQEEVQKLIAK